MNFDQAVPGLGEIINEQVKERWCSEQEAMLRAVHPNFENYDSLARTKLFLERLLSSDALVSFSGSLPDLAEQTILSGTYIVQVEEIIDVTQNIKERHDIKARTPRLLKMQLTDGKRHVIALENQSLVDFENLALGAKLLLLGPITIARGVLLLNPNNVEILGGCVAELEAQRQAIIAILKEQPVGRRGPPLSLEQFVAQVAQRIPQTLNIQNGANGGAPSPQRPVSPPQAAPAGPAVRPQGSPVQLNRQPQQAQQAHHHQQQGMPSLQQSISFGSGHVPMATNVNGSGGGVAAAVANGGPFPQHAQHQPYMPPAHGAAPGMAFNASINGVPGDIDDEDVEWSSNSSDDDDEQRQNGMNNNRPTPALQMGAVGNNLPGVSAAPRAPQSPPPPMAAPPAQPQHEVVNLVDDDDDDFWGDDGDDQPMPQAPNGINSTHAHPNVQPCPRNDPAEDEHSRNPAEVALEGQGNAFIVQPANHEQQAHPPPQQNNGNAHDTLAPSPSNLLKTQHEEIIENSSDEEGRPRPPISHQHNSSGKKSRKSGSGQYRSSTGSGILPLTTIGNPKTGRGSDVGAGTNRTGESGGAGGSGGGHLNSNLGKKRRSEGDPVPMDVSEAGPSTHTLPGPAHTSSAKGATTGATTRAVVGGGGGVLNSSLITEKTGGGVGGIGNGSGLEASPRARHNLQNEFEKASTSSLLIIPPPAQRQRQLQDAFALLEEQHLGLAQLRAGIAPADVHNNEREPENESGSFAFPPLRLPAPISPVTAVGSGAAAAAAAVVAPRAAEGGPSEHTPHTSLRAQHNTTTASDVLQGNNLAQVTAHQQQEANQPHPSADAWGSQGPQPYTYIAEFAEYLQNGHPHTYPLSFSIFGSIKTILSSQKSEDGESVQIKAEVEDATGSMQVMISQALLLDSLNASLAQNGAGFVLQSVKEIWEGGARNVELKKAMQQVKAMLKAHYGLIELMLHGENEIAELVQLLGEDLTASQIEELRNRVQNGGGGA